MWAPPSGLPFVLHKRRPVKCAPSFGGANPPPVSGACSVQPASESPRVSVASPLPLAPGCACLGVNPPPPYAVGLLSRKQALDCSYSLECPVRKKQGGQSACIHLGLSDGSILHAGSLAEDPLWPLRDPETGPPNAGGAARPRGCPGALGRRCLTSGRMGGWGVAQTQRCSPSLPRMDEWL